MKIFKELKGMLRLREAVNQAEEAHRKNGERYYVMPSTGTSGDLIIMDRKNFRKLKQKGYIKRTSFVADLESMCFYATPYRNGVGQIPVRKELYTSWLESLKVLKENEKFKKLEKQEEHENQEA
ncbi:MAG: hypothetical protein IJY60_05225 [Bacteroides sp.]|nr:hypothetical protein [Bacteroides sp.]